MAGPGSRGAGSPEYLNNENAGIANGSHRMSTETGASALQPRRGLAQRAPNHVPGSSGPGLASRHPALGQLVILAGYIAAGILATWPRATYLVQGKLPATRDAGSYVWDFWWVFHQIEHLGNPWFTRSIAAPIGTHLGYHALMPLEGLVMTPITAAFGPSASYNLLSILSPGLMSYTAYRAARLWVPSRTGAIAAGAFYGLSADLAWHAWYQVNLAAGAVFLPLALEAAVRLRRRAGAPQSAVLGAVLGASLLTDQESAVLAIIVAVAALLPWLLRHDSRQPIEQKVASTALATAVMLVVASPQIVAMAQQTGMAGASYPRALLAPYYVTSGTEFPAAFSISPRVVRLGLSIVRPATYPGPLGDGVPTYGLMLSVLAAIGLAVSWRRRTAWYLALLWLGATALALGATLRIGNQSYVPLAETWGHSRVSPLLPYTWFVQLPGLSGFREADRIMILGLLPASLLAGAAVNWLRHHAVWVIVPVAMLAVVEAGWPGGIGRPLGTMPTTLPALDGPIAADHSDSLVVDVPFGLRGGVTLPNEGARFDPEAQVLATADGHPRSVAYLARIPSPVLLAVRRNPFYAGLLTAQGDQLVRQAEELTGAHTYQALVAAARAESRRMNVGWIIVWHSTERIRRYLAVTGFRFHYRANGASVYRPDAAEVSRE